MNLQCMGKFLYMYIDNCHQITVSHSPEGSLKPFPSQYLWQKVTTIPISITIDQRGLFLNITLHIIAIIQSILFYLASFSQKSENHPCYSMSQQSAFPTAMEYPLYGQATMYPLYCCWQALRWFPFLTLLAELL